MTGAAGQDGGSEILAFLFTDLVESSAAADDVLRRHLTRLCEIVGANGGKVVKTLGDGVMAAFTSAAAAAACGTALVRDTAAATPGLGVRVGLHAGEAERHGQDYSGHTVTIAKRLCDQARPGQVLCSDLVRALAAGHADLRFRPVGTVSVKGIADPVDVAEVLDTIDGSDVAIAAPAPGSGLVGRGREVQELDGVLDAARSGRGGLALLTGDPGIGKTRLAEEISEHARRAGAWVQWGSCWEAGGAPAYWPWAEVLRGIARELGSASAQAVGDRAPLLAQLAPELGAPAPASETDRFALFDAVTGFLDAVAKARPLVLVFDDLHAADQSSLLLLHFLGRRLRSMRVFVIGTSRDLEVERDPTLSELLAEIARLGRRLPLGGLARDDVAVLLERITAAVPASDLVDRVHANTGGNPFFVDEVARLVAAGRRPTVPAGIKHAVRQNLSFLPPDVGEALATASVLGREFTVERLAELISLPADAVLRMLGEAESARVVRQTPVAGRFEFAHALVMETLYEDLGLDRRQRFHLAVAERLEPAAAEDGSQLAELAHHFAEAGDDRAIDASMRAGEWAMHQLAYEQAADLYRRALAMLATGDDLGRFELLVRLCQADMAAGRVGPEHWDSVAEAVALARRLDRVDLLVRAALLPQPEEIGVQLTDEVLARLGDTDLAARGELLGRLTSRLREGNDWARVLPTAEEAVRVARRSGDPIALLNALSGYAQALQGSHLVAERQAASRELMELADQVGTSEATFSAHHARASAAIATGNVAELDGIVEAIAALAKSSRQVRYVFFEVILRACRLLVAGRLAEAEPLAIQQYAMAKTLAGGLAASFTQVFHIRREQGRLADIEGQVAEFADQFPQFPWRPRLALLHIDLGRPQQARALFEQLVVHDFADLRPDNLTFSLPLLSELAWALGDARRAELLFERVLPYEGQCFAASGGNVHCTGAVTRYLGLLAAAMGRTDDAVRYLEDAVAFHQRMPAPLLLAHTQVDLAVVTGNASRCDPAKEPAERGGWELVRRRIEQMSAPSPPVPAPASQSAGVTGAFRRQGDTWTVSFDDTAFNLRHARGCELLARLLAEPGREFHALDLEQGAAPRPRATSTTADDLATDPAGSAGAALDEQAKRAYKRRLDELEEEIDEASLNNDPARLDKAEAEKAFLLQELKAAVGLGGRDRPTSSAAERARVNVTRAIRSVLARIGDHHPGLGDHLAATIRTGTFCSYSPDPRLPIRWEL